MHRAIETLRSALKGHLDCRHRFPSTRHIHVAYCRDIIKALRKLEPKRPPMWAVDVHSVYWSVSDRGHYDEGERVAAVYARSRLEAHERAEHLARVLPKDTGSIRHDHAVGNCRAVWREQCDLCRLYFVASDMVPSDLDKGEAAIYLLCVACHDEECGGNLAGGYCEHCTPTLWAAYTKRAPQPIVTNPGF